MKFLILFAALFMSLSAFARPASVNVPPFKGNLKLSKNMTVTQVRLDVVLNYNNCFMGFCTYNPNNKINENLQFSEDKNLVSIELGHELNVVAEDYKSFHNCELNLTIEAVDRAGQTYTGFAYPLKSDKKKLCSSLKEMKEYLKASFSKPLEVELSKNYY